MKLVYVAGPFRGRTPWVVECNVREAEAASLTIAKLGVAPVCPHTMYRFFDGSMPDEFWLLSTLELMRRCDAVYLLPGWQMSSGARSEYDFAMSRGMPVFDTLMALTQWAAKC